MRIKFLAPTSFQNGKDYFSEFFRTNKIGSPKFSYRSFAQEIKWPASYLPDLISGRKQLSIQRALQFADHFKMNNIDKEHLLWLAMSRSSTSFGSATHDQRTNPNSRLYPGGTENDFVLKNDIIWVSRFLLWKRRQMSAQEIHHEFEVSSVSLSRIEAALKAIAEQGLLRWNSDGTLHAESSKSPEEFDHSTTKGDKTFEGIELHIDSTLNFLKFIEKPQVPSTYHTRIVAIPKDQFMPIAIKLIDLRNWIDEISRQHLAESKSPEASSYLMQLDINFFPVKKKKL